MIKVESTPQFNIAKLKKCEIEWLAGHTCKHRVNFLSHPSCYFSERPTESPLVERVGFLDIESSNLKASFGIVLSWAIKERGKKKVLGRAITRAEILSKDTDKNLIKEFYRTASGFDRLAVYWGKDRRHDIPFLRTRALKHKVSFPPYRAVHIVDVYDWTKNKMSLHSYRLETVCRELGIPAKGHPLNGDVWIKALQGDGKALAYLWKHNVEDVVCLEPVYDRLECFVRNNKVSI